MINLISTCDAEIRAKLLMGDPALRHRLELTPLRIGALSIDANSIDDILLRQLKIRANKGQRVPDLEPEYDINDHKMA